jgi:hypothetical protein
LPALPLLFLVVMEALSRMLIATMDQGLLTGFLVGSRDNGGLEVSHLLFADDALIFGCEHSNKLDICTVFS